LTSDDNYMGLPSRVETDRLEKQADEILRADAKASGAVRANGRGYSAYFREHGMTSSKILETVYKREAVGFSEEGLEALAGAEPFDPDDRDGPRLPGWLIR
jgi:hypothetical protein